MKAPILITTVGTSILGPGSRPKDQTSAKTHIRKRIEEHLSDYAPPEALQRLSAETNSLSRFTLESSTEVVLLTTDTDLGQWCGEALKELIEEHLQLPVTSVERISGLQVDDARRFRREGIQNLFERLDRLLGEHRYERQDKPVLNVTGGFKSVVPYMTIYGILRRFPVIYLFEGSSELITLPPLPLSYDRSLLLRAQKALTSLRREGVMDRNAVHGLVRDFIPEDATLLASLFEEDESGAVTLSAFGEILVDDEEMEQVPVFLSSEAWKTYRQSRGTQREYLDILLSHITTPGWIDTHVHAFRGTDLQVLKPGNTAARAAGYRKGRAFSVCVLYPDHDQYERELPGRTRAQFEDLEFTPWIMESDPETPAPTDVWDQIEQRDQLIRRMRNEQDTDREAIRGLRDEVDRKKEELGAGEKKNQNLIARGKELERSVSTLEEETAALRAQKDLMVQRLGQLSLRDRLRLLFSPRESLRRIIEAAPPL